LERKLALRLALFQSRHLVGSESGNKAISGATLFWTGWRSAAHYIWSRSCVIIAGVDVGAKITKVALVGGGQLLSRGRASTGFDRKGSAQRAFDEALRTAGVSADRVVSAVATGVGRKAVAFATKQVTEVAADVRGSIHSFPSARIVIDVGAEEARAIKCDERGMVVDFAMNEKCAAGVGAFVDSMARALDLTIEEMGELSLQSREAIALNAQCAVFTESEVVSLMHGRTQKKDIARAVHDAIASRIGCLVRTLGIEGQVVFVGGLASNLGLVDALRRNLGVDLLVPENPEYTGAIGAALIALDELGGK
jgi:benzoyl-CoA reductase subunit D